MPGVVRIGFVSLFPEQIQGALLHGVAERAVQAGLAQLEFANPRTHAEGAHRAVDDRPFGGGPGMVLMPNLVRQALDDLEPEGARIILTDPAGEPFRQADARRFAALSRVIFLCGHYEGMDERAANLAHERRSIGDFVVTGGEVPAALMADAIIRLLPGALGKEASHETDSFEDGLLGYPVYTRPVEFEGEEPPAVLRSGDHGKVQAWRRRQQLLATRRRRPDLFARAPLSPEDLRLLGTDQD